MKPRIVALSFMLSCLVVPMVLGQGDDKGKGRRPNAPRPGAGDRPGGMLPNGGPGFGGLGGGQGGLGMMMKFMPVMTALDTDQDGTLSESEIANASKSLLKLDKNGDGVLSQEELKPDPSSFPGMAGGGIGMGGNPEGGPPNGAMMKRMFETRDANRDGKLSGDEIPEMLKNRLSAIDKDGDGAIQKSELERAATMLGDRANQRPGRGNGNDGSGVKPKRPE